MEAGTVQAPQSPPEEEPSRPFPPEVEAAAQGKTLSDREEGEALKFLVGATYRPQHEVRVQFDTPAGLKPLVFVLNAVDGARINELEKEYTEGDNPMTQEVDTIGLAAAMIAESVVAIKDDDGGSIEPHSEVFRGEVPDTVAAIRGRFKYQAGLLDGLAGRVRQISGWAPDRVGQSQRAVVAASGN